MYYNGAINTQGYEEFRRVMDVNQDVDAIVINSGGDTAAGRDIGEIVHES